MAKFNKPLEQQNQVDKKYSRSLVQTKDNGNKLITFSFRYFSQQDYFGIGDVPSSWIAALFDRLKEFNGKTNKIIDNITDRKKYRFHPIDWKGENVPITLNDIESIPQLLKDNAEDDFLWQFQLSKANGRVIGFFNESFDIFYIVLLDPKHNLQPSKNFGYVVNDTDIAFTPYENISMKVSEIISECKNKCKCNIDETLDLNNNLLFIPIDKEFQKLYIKAVDLGELKKIIENYLLERL